MKFGSIRGFLEIGFAICGCVLLTLALTGVYWYDIFDADLTSQGYGKRMQITSEIKTYNITRKHTMCFTPLTR